MTEIRELRREDISPIAEAFANIGWDKPASQYERYLREQTEGKRRVFVAFEDDEFAGYLTIVFESKYPPFTEEKIPEINDFNVLPAFRRRKIGTKLMDAAEEFAARRSKIIGIGVGLDKDYGAAQRLYVLRGYVPDGRGVSWQNRFPKYGEQVSVDDDLNLYLTKTLNAETRTK
jgi:GNAT superfamily N-acetyltransferase